MPRHFRKGPCLKSETESGATKFKNWDHVKSQELTDHGKYSPASQPTSTRMCAFASFAVTPF